MAYCAAVCESLIRSNGAQVGDRPIPVDVGFEAVLGLKAVLRDVGQGDESQSESSELRVSHAITAIGMLGRFCGERGIAAFSQFAAEIDPRVMSYSGVQLLKSVLQVFSHNSDLAPLRYALDSFPPRYIADRYQPPRRKKLSEMFAYLDRCLSQGEAASNLSSQGIYDLVRRMGGVALSRLVADLDQNKQTSNEASVDCLLMAIACTHTRAGLNQLNLAKYQYPIQARSAIAAMASSVSDSKLADVARNAFWAGAVASSIELGCVPTRHLRALLPDDPRQVSADRVAHVVSGLLRRSRVAEDLNLVTVAGDIVEVARGRASALLAKLWGDNSYVMDMQIEGGLQFWRGPDFEVLAQEPERVAGLLGVTRDPEISSGELTKRVNFLLSASRDWNNREQALCVLRAAELANLPYALVAKLKLSTAVSAMSKRGESNRRGRFLSGVASFVGRFSTMLSGAFQGLIVSRDDL